MEQRSTVFSVRCLWHFFGVTGGAIEAPEKRASRHSYSFYYQSPVTSHNNAGHFTSNNWGRQDVCQYEHAHTYGMSMRLCCYNVCVCVYLHTVCGCMCVCACVFLRPDTQYLRISVILESLICMNDSNNLLKFRSKGWFTISWKSLWSYQQITWVLFARLLRRSILRTNYSWWQIRLRLTIILIVHQSADYTSG